jgi:hypothetical protein
LRGKRQIARANGAHVALLSPRAEVFKTDLVWNEPALARMLHRRLIEDRASPASGNGPLRFFFSLNFEPGTLNCEAQHRALRIATESEGSSIAS